MKTFSRKIWQIMSVLLLSLVIVSCNDDNDVAPLSFELSSIDLECNSDKVIDVIVPIEAQTYKLTVKASVDAAWSTKVEGGNWLVATPVTEQKGDGEIVIIASSNPNNIQGRTATVIIRNSVNDQIFKYQFTQLYDKNQMLQREENVTFEHYSEDLYNGDLDYTTTVNKMDGDVNLSVLTEGDLAEYNEANATRYKLLPINCYSALPSTIVFGEETSAPLNITFKKEVGELDANEEYMLPICLMTNEKVVTKIWITVNINIINIKKIVKTFDFCNADEDVKYFMTVDKKEGEVTLVPFTQEEMTEYNGTNNTNYTLLSADLISMPTSIDFNELESSKEVEIIFKRGIGKLSKDKEHVWGLRVCVDGKPTSDIFIKPNVVTPVVSVQYSDYKVFSLLEKGAETVSFDFNLALDIDNKWDFTVEFEKRIEVLQAAVDKYNKEKGTSCTLLPVANCTLSSSSFTSGKNTKSITATLSRVGLESEKEYLFPVILSGCSDKPFNVTDKICYVQVFVVKSIPEISLTEAMLKASSENRDDKVSLVLNQSYEKYWQSIWEPVLKDPKLDPTYGAYIDIDLSGAGQAPDKFISLNYATRSWPNATPNHIAIYAGTSKDNLKKVGELKREDNNLPTKGSKWIGGGDENKEILPVFSLKGEKATLVRLAFLSNFDGTNNNKTVTSLVDFDLSKHTSGNFPCVSIARLKLYGR